MLTIQLSGFYTINTYTVVGDNGKMPKFSAMIDEAAHTITGSGHDGPGAFVIGGVLVGNEVRFIKQYINCNGNIAWKYVGKRLEPKGNVFLFSGGWGQGAKQHGHWVLSGIAPSMPMGMGHTHPIAGHWEGNYHYADNIKREDGPMHITIGLDSSASYNADGPYHISGIGSDGIGGFTLKGTVTKAGAFDVKKTYHTRQGTWSWHYQGKYDKSGHIDGTWGQVGDGAAAHGNGHFKLTQRHVMPLAVAQSTMPAKAVLHSASTAANISTAIHAATSSSPHISAGTLHGLSTGFSSH